MVECWDISLWSLEVEAANAWASYNSIVKDGSLSRWLIFSMSHMNLWLTAVGNKRKPCLIILLIAPDLLTSVSTGLGKPLILDLYCDIHALRKTSRFLSKAIIREDLNLLSPHWNKVWWWWFQEIEFCSIGSFMLLLPGGRDKKTEAGQVTICPTPATLKKEICLC